MLPEMHFRTSDLRATIAGTSPLPRTRTRDTANIVNIREALS